MARVTWIGNPGGCCCDDECVITVTVTNCSGGGFIDGATVTVKNSVGTQVAEEITNSSGVATINLPGTGTYTITSSKAGFPPAIRSVVISFCPADIPIIMGMSIVFTAYGCGLIDMVIPGVAVTATLGADTYSAVTDSLGVATIAVQSAGTYSITSSHPSGRIASVTNNLIVSGCTTNLNRSHNPGTGYHCFHGCALGVADTLFLTDSTYGAVTLTFSVPNNRWQGSGSGSYAGCGGCPAKAVVISYTMTQDGHLTAQIDSPVGQCPANLGAPTLTYVSSLCPPAAFEAVYTISPTTAGWCSGSTFTITE
jgi:hypothetical protein